MRTFDKNTMTRINDVKQVLRYRTYTDRRYRLIDTSGGTASGDSYDLVEQVKQLEHFKNDDGVVVVSEWCWNTVRKIASSHDTSMPDAINKIGGIGAYGPTFDAADISEIKQF